MHAFSGVLAGLLLVGLSACSLPASSNVTSSGGEDIASKRGESYRGPKARIAVADFEDKMSSTGYYRSEYGRGMADMLTNALFHTNRFIVLERDKIQAVLAEQDLGASGRVKQETAAGIGDIEGAELLVTAAITGFDPGVSGGSGGAGGDLFGAFGGMVDKLAGSVQTARVAMDLRVIDTRTARVLAATSVEGTATGVSGEAGYTATGLGSTLSGFSKTPMERAIRDMIETAVEYVVSQTPERYYHYSPSGEPLTQVQSGSGGAPMGATAAVEGSSQGGFAEGAHEGAELEQKFRDTPESMTASVAPAAPAVSAPAAPDVLELIRADLDNDVVAALTEVKRRGALLSVTISLQLRGDRKKSQYLRFSKSPDATYVMDYQTASTFGVKKLGGFTEGRIRPGETKTVRVLFEAPPESCEIVGITVAGLGAFDDIELK